MSYLGKISALVTINTGDFAPKLNAAARDVRSFAKAVESNIGSSMRAATKALDDIYTPLQKFERSLRAAASMKLSFAGFPGAIRDLDELKQRMTSLNKRQIDVILKTSGLKDITSFREILTGLRSREFDLIVKVGGGEKLNQLRDSMLEGDNRIELFAETKEAMDRVAALRAQIEEVKSGKATVTVGVVGVEEATARLGAAKAAVEAFVREESGGRRSKPGGFASSLTERIAAGEQELAALRVQQANRDRLLAEAESPKARRRIAANSPDRSQEIEAKQAEVDSLAVTVAKLGTLVGQYNAAKDGLAASKDAASGGGLKRLEREARDAERATKDLLDQLQTKVSAKLGFTIDLKSLESLVSGDVATQATQLTERLRAMGVSAADASKMVSSVMTALGQSDQSAAISQLQRLQSAAEGLGKPLQQVRDKVLASGRDIEAAFGGTLSGLQGRIEALKLQIAKAFAEGDTAAGVKALDDAFRRLAADIGVADDAASRFSETSAKLGQMKTGNELAFSSPRLNAAIARSTAIGNSAAALPQDVISANPQIAENLVRINKLTNEAAAARARLDDAMQSGNVYAVPGAQNELDRLLAELNQLQSRTEEGIQVHLDAAQAEKDAQALAATIDRLRAEANFKITAVPQNFEQVQSELSRILGTLGKIDAADQVEIRARASEVIDAIGRNDLPGAVARLDQLGTSAEMINNRPPPGPVFTPLPRSYLQEGFDRQTRGILGKELGDGTRRIAGMGQAIVALKGQLDGLPAPIIAHFIPAIQAAEQEFARLRALGPAATAEEIENAIQRMRTLEAATGRATRAASFERGLGGRNAQDFELNLQGRSLQGYQAQLQVLQQTLGNVSMEARGPAAASFLRLQQVISTAFQNGTLDAAGTREEIQRLTREAVADTARVANVGAGGLGRRVQRAGDIGRGGFDRWSLALNQAAFAVDDFMSSTGGIEFKLRAISNNITQLGFVLGGTTGLFIGLGAVIAGQAAIAIMKWVNNGRTAEDQTKALNEALARQKSLLEDLSQAFKSLGDAMSRGTMSPAAQQLAEFSEQLRDIQKKQAAIRENRIFDVDPNIQRERAQQNAGRRALESETDIGRRIAIARQIRESELRERGAMARLRVQPAPSGFEVAQKIESAARRMEEAGRAQRPGDEVFPLADALRAAGREVDQGGTPEGIKSQIQSLDQAQKALEEASKKTVLGLFPTQEAAVASVALSAFEDLKARLQAQLDKAVDASLVQVAEASRGPAEQIRQAQEEVAEAIKLGIPGAMLFQHQLDENAKQLKKAYDDLEAAVGGKDEDGNELDVIQQQERIEAARATVAELEGRRAAMRAQTDALAYERIVDPQRQIEARMGRARSNLSAAGLEDGVLARRLREIEAERERLQRLGQEPENQTEDAKAGIAEQEAALNKQVAAIEATTIALKIYTAELNRSSEEVRGNLNSAQQRADEARRADLVYDTPQTNSDRRRAESDLDFQRAATRAAETEIAVRRDDIQELNRPRQRELQEIDEQLASGSLASDERERLIRRRAAIQAQMEDHAREMNAWIEGFRDHATRIEERQRSAQRGRELGRTPGEKAAEETRRGLVDIRNAYDDPQERQAAARRFADDMRRNAAPAIATLGDSVQNAIISGPSRAALNVSDISTSEGARELNRLLRGEDSAKDQNFVELQRQSNALDEINRVLREGVDGLKVG